MLCELVFMYYAELKPGNGLPVTGDPGDDAIVTVLPTLPPAAVLAESDQLAAAVLAGLGAQPVPGENGLGLQEAPLGGVAHEVGTSRTSDGGAGMVDADLRFLGLR